MMFLINVHLQLVIPTDELRHHLQIEWLINWIIDI